MILAKQEWYMIKKTDLRIGNIFEQGIVCKINGRTGAKVHVYGKLKWKKGLKVIESVAVEDLKPIALSPQVLVDWCGFKDMNGGIYVKDDMSLVWDGEKVYFVVGGKFKNLHELQNLYYVIHKKELEIKE